MATFRYPREAASELRFAAGTDGKGAESASRGTAAWPAVELAARLTAGGDLAVPLRLVDARGCGAVPGGTGVAGRQCKGGDRQEYKGCRVWHLVLPLGPRR